MDNGFIVDKYWIMDNGPHRYLKMDPKTITVDI